VRFNTSQKLKWWQIRTTEFALLLYALITQRVLVLGIWVIGATFSDSDEVPLSSALDTSFAGNHPPSMIFGTITLSWIFFTTCIVSAWVERPYGWKKSIFVFLCIGVVLGLTTWNIRQAFSPIF